MNKKYTECDIVRELLPLYIEQKTGEESNEFINKHLPGCAECREVHGWMCADLLEGNSEENTYAANQDKRRPKRKSKYVMKRWLAVVVGLTAYIVLLWLIVVFTFLYLAV